MKLTRLELNGFKSFADSVTLDFEDGVTAIVGPNGCGKSNVSDAVRWVLGEQSARLLRGGKMEDVIFQGSAARRPVNVTEVSLFLDNSDGTLPIAYQEVQVTRRLSRSGQSDYLLNGATVRLRDIQDLLRGTGLGSDAGVVIEAKMIDLLLSDRADERRSLFEEAAGIGLYRDRKHTTERRLEETGHDLQRVEDLIAEVQSQIRSLARQRGKAERHARLTEEKQVVQVTLARRRLERMATDAAAMEDRHRTLASALPAGREEVIGLEGARDDAARARGGAEAARAEIARRLGDVRVELGRLDGDLALAAERMANASARRVRAADERGQMEMRADLARRERGAAEEEQRTAEAESGRIGGELEARAAAEEQGRARLAEGRQSLRAREDDLQGEVQRLRALEGERTALEGELASLREQAAQAEAHRASLGEELAEAEARRASATEEAARRGDMLRAAAAGQDRARHLVAETREHEATGRAARRRAEEALAQLLARRQALEELDRDRVGLAPGAAALLAARDRFDGGVLGPLSDYVSAGRDDAELAERLLGEWVHAVLVRDEAAVAAIRAWHEEAQPGAIVLLPLTAARVAADEDPLAGRLRAESEDAARWVHAILGGSRVLDGSGRVLRRANGAVLLTGSAAPSGPLRRRAELRGLGGDAAAAEAALEGATAALDATLARLAEIEQALADASTAADRARDAERQSVAAREDASRLAGNLAREMQEAESRLARVAQRLQAAEARLGEVDRDLTEGEVARARLEEEVGVRRAALADLEATQEQARDARVHWQVQLAQVEARLGALREKAERATRQGEEATSTAVALAQELGRLEADGAGLERQQAQWLEARAERRVAVLELEAAAADGEEELADAASDLDAADRRLHDRREAVEAMAEEYHRLQLELSEVGAQRRRVTERLEAEWRRGYDELVAAVEPLDLELEALVAEDARIVEALEGIGPVNPLAVEEHAEESRRLEFLTGQRDDLVAARQSLTQAIREIDGTARAMFQETFDAIRGHFLQVFQTLFGGGECDLRLATPDDPLESEIEIHAAPRGKRTQRIHLLSSGERTLVATSLLFAIYLTKPSPFCLMDEVDAPLDDANVGRFTTLLDEFKDRTQFIVITHNPRTMQAADAVYGVTMQEPGVSTIVGVRLGARAEA